MTSRPACFWPFTQAHDATRKSTGHLLKALSPRCGAVQLELSLISDHGHPLGEYGYTGKLHYALYPELTDIVFFMRHPARKKAGEKTDYLASTHDIAPTILGALGIGAPTPMEGEDLSVLLEGKNPNPREHFTLGYGRYVWCRNESYEAFCRDDLDGARLFDVHNDPRRERDLAGDDPQRVEKMFKEYVLEDAGGVLPCSRTLVVIHCGQEKPDCSSSGT